MLRKTLRRIMKSSLNFQNTKPEGFFHKNDHKGGRFRSRVKKMNILNYFRVSFTVQVKSKAD